MATKAKRPFRMSYETYDDSEGRGSSDEWRDYFGERMGHDAAKEAVGDNTPHGILGLQLGAEWSEVKAAYRKLAREWHPDANAHRPEEAAAMMTRINGAYTLIAETYGKK